MGQQLVTIDNGDRVVQREEAMARRRRDAELHHHRAVWTKASHGGPYQVQYLRSVYDWNRGALERPGPCPWWGHPN
jgi:hypothetical protein